VPITWLFNPFPSSFALNYGWVGSSMTTTTFHFAGIILFYFIVLVKIEGWSRQFIGRCGFDGSGGWLGGDFDWLIEALEEPEDWTRLVGLTGWWFGIFFGDHYAQEIWSARSLWTEKETEEPLVQELQQIKWKQEENHFGGTKNQPKIPNKKCAISIVTDSWNKAENPYKERLLIIKR
jgi:hypothetical protein